LKVEVAGLESVCGDKYKINHLNLILVSIYECHSNKHRPISNDRSEMEASLVVNGPLSACRQCYKGDVQNKWIHFLRRGFIDLM
jgi:hypothetical protein